MKPQLVFIYLIGVGAAVLQPRAIAATGPDCFVATAPGIIYKYTSEGAQSVYATNMGWPFGLAFDRAGNLFVANRDGGLYEIETNGSTHVFADLYNGPSALTFDSSGNLFVGVFGNGYIFKYTPDGTRNTFGIEPDLQGYGNNGRPVGLAFDHAGTLYASDEYYGYIYRGVPGSPFASAPGAPWGLAFDSRDNLFVADSSGGRICKYARNGGILSFSYTTFASNLNNPIGLAFDGNDNLFVADYIAGKVYKFDTNGVRTTFASVLGPTAVAFSSISKPADLPLLSILPAGGGVTISWPNAGSCTLVQCSNLAVGACWSTNTSWITSNGTNSLRVTDLSGPMFFRLIQP